MDDVLFVRELAADRDLVLAFTADGTPAWALDLESGLQWWYADGDRDDVRHAITERWNGFRTMPITAASSGGPHPARELARQAAGRPTAGASGEDAAVLAAHRVLGEGRRRLSAPARLAVSVGAVLVALPLGLGLLLGASGGPATHTVDDSATPRTSVQTAGAPCSVRGDTAHDAAARPLVCVPVSRAFPSLLAWRVTG